MSDEQQGHRSGTAVSSDDGGELGDRSALVARVQELEAEVLKARHAQLLNRDHVVGIEAEIGRQNADIIRLNGELRRLQGRAKRLNARKIAQAKRIAGLQTKLDNVRKQNAALTRRIDELEAGTARPSLARRVVRRVRGTAR